MKEQNPVGWFEIYVDDMPRAQKFYETVLDTKLEPLSPPSDGNGPDLEMWAFPGTDEKAYGATGALAKMAGMSPGQNSVLIYFSCEDCAIEEARIEEAGGKVMQKKTSIGEYGQIAIACDTEGNTFGLHSEK